MKAVSDQRAFLFLQGPPGPFFRLLAKEIEAKGIPVHRINLSGGDRLDWPEVAVDFLDRFSEWPVFLDHFLRDHQITDLLLYGDCRPYHVSAHGIAALRGLRTHVLEEGYLRPDWMTLELEGVNARSMLSRDKKWFVAQARQLPPEPELPPITASFRRRARDSYWHYHNVVIGRLRYRHYRSHRSGSIFMEGLGWLWKFLRAGPKSPGRRSGPSQSRRQADIRRAAAAFGRLPDQDPLLLSRHAERGGLYDRKLRGPCTARRPFAAQGASARL